MQTQETETSSSSRAPNSVAKLSCSSGGTRLIHDLDRWRTLTPHKHIAPILGVALHISNLPALVVPAFRTVAQVLKQDPQKDVLSLRPAWATYTRKRPRSRMATSKAPPYSSHRPEPPSSLTSGLLQSRRPPEWDFKTGDDARWLAPEVLYPSLRPEVEDGEGFQASKTVTCESDVYVFAIASYEVNVLQVGSRSLKPHSRHVTPVTIDSDASSCFSATSTDGNPQQPPVKLVRSYQRHPPPEIIPVITSFASASTPGSPVTPSPSSASTQPSLRAARRTKWQKVDGVSKTYGFPILGDFLACLFTCVLVPTKKDSEDYHSAFSPNKPLTEIQCARPCLSAWATRLVGNHAYFRVGKLARKNRVGGSRRRHLRATTNGLVKNTDVVTWEDTEFTLQGLAHQYQDEDPFVWYLTECFTASRKKGKVVVKKNRPHPVIQVGAISSFILSRNQLGLPLGLWLFACQAHVDVKRVFCRFGYSVSDSTSRKALNSMTDSSMNHLQEKVRDATERGTADYGKILDNIQRYDRVFEQGLGRESQLKVGTACTAFRLENAKPGALRADDHIARVIAQERQKMTTESVLASIDWEHNYSVADLHFVRILADFIPHLNHLSTEISTRFRTTLAKRRVAPVKTVLQPLGTNSEREVENKGMQSALLDFDKQMGVEPEKSDNILSWVRGDGASHATVMRLKKILATSPNIYDSFRNVISTPETWHTKATDLNSCASNHFGPAASKDPSSLSHNSNATNMKRPTDLKKCDFYPTSRNLIMIWEARVLDCWRLVLGCKADLLGHFDALAAKTELPTLDELLKHASLLRERYASQTAYEQSLDKAEQDDAEPRTKFPVGSTWTRPCARETPAVEPETDADTEMPGLADIPEDTDSTDDNRDTDKPAVDAPSTTEQNEVPPETKADEDGPKFHKEKDGFDGDRVLSNSILFLMEFGWWIELNYAIPEGDVGRVFEILKIFVFTFAGTSNQNYIGYMLDLYALLEFECSPELKETLLDNWLFNLRGEAGKFIEGDLMQEWNNRWLEDIAGRRGGEFDDKFYRKNGRPKCAHLPTSPQRDPILLRVYEDEELHSFRSGRSMGHAAVNRFDRGYQRLDEGKMGEFLQRSAEYAGLVREMEAIRKSSSVPGNLGRGTNIFSPENEKLGLPGEAMLVLYISK
ncbi:hypothetical protein B0H14DRAFT_2584918 [Mycena olivaceomarginata]|nr:hypothetical protein B0H14DRAFT_2584918 [Mycena olivaceomarginata]